jgi:hypothetical protein
MNAVQGQEQERKKPALIAYSVKLGADDNVIWTRIGAAWAHRKSGGFSIELDALPLEGRIVLVAPSAEPEDSSGRRPGNRRKD